jgi:NDP-sugar pyrophosphorylase family protein
LKDLCCTGDPEQNAGHADRCWEYIESYLHGKTDPLTVPGSYYTLRTVVDYYDFHCTLLNNVEASVHARSLPADTDKTGEDQTHIGARGVIKDSHIGHSCTVDGWVEGSVLFPHVKVANNARVRNAVVMKNNSVGSGAVIERAIIGDSPELFTRVTPNIGEGARIGMDDTTGSNVDAPEYLCGGITLIGRNVEIPHNFRISKNCFIGSNIDRAVLKGLHSLEEGGTVAARRYV